MPRRPSVRDAACRRVLVLAVMAAMGGCSPAAPSRSDETSCDAGICKGDSLTDSSPDADRGPDAAASEIDGGVAVDASCWSGCAAGQIEWAGMTWRVRSGWGGPGPNRWDSRNVSVDDQGRLHLRLVRREGEWTAAEISSTESFHFGRYQFFVEGAIDELDPSVVLGLFTYPELGTAPDGTNEIDIEIARWGDAQNSPLNFTVWPTSTDRSPSSESHPMELDGTFTTHRFDWRSDQIAFGSYHGFRFDDQNPIATRTYAPVDPEARIAQMPLRVHLNLWLFQGAPPTDGEEVHLVIADFAHTPE